MATTTNYSWTTPDDTDLVSQGASAIRTLGTAIDSTVFTNAGAAINKSLVDAAGDLIYGTADNTVARLAIGTADQVLKVNSGATAPEWGTAPSGGMTLISTTTLSSTSTSLTSIPQTYNHLQLVLMDATCSVNGETINFRPNGDSGTNYSSTLITANGNEAMNTNRVEGNPNLNNANESNMMILNIPFYTTTNYKIYSYSGVAVAEVNTANLSYRYAPNVIHKNTSAITSITIYATSGNLSGTAYLYGVK